MLTKIGFKGYKLFKHYNEIEIKPITVLFGKNSSGKSSITKLLYVFLNTFEGIEEDLEYSPFALEHNDVEIGAEFRDLVYGRSINGSIELSFVGINKNNNYEGNLRVVFGNKNDLEFNPIILEHESSNFSYNRNLSKSDYIGPLRAKPKRDYRNFHKSYYEYHDGSFAYDKLIFELISESDMVKKLNNFYLKSFGGWSIKLNKDRAPVYQIELENNHSSINIVDTGQGNAQFLPIAVRCFVPVEDDTICIIEQPELHLHPAVHGDIAELMVGQTIDDPNKSFLIETHSQNYMLRIRRLIAEGIIDFDKVRFYFVDYDEKQSLSTIKHIKINKKGEVDFWPEGIFEETYVEAKELLEAQLESNEI